MTKKIIYILICYLMCINIAHAKTQQGSINYSGPQYSFAPNACPKYLKNANMNMRLFENAETQADKLFYLNEAMRYYFLVEKIDFSCVEAQIGLGRVYDELKMDSFAKKHFCNASNLDRTNPYMNSSFGDFYYKRSDFINAMAYYQNAFKNGYSNNFQLNCKIAATYEKLADIEMAKKHYKIALSLKQSDNNILEDKIRLLDELNYGGSQYYLFKQSGKR